MCDEAPATPVEVVAAPNPRRSFLSLLSGLLVAAVTFPPSRARAKKVALEVAKATELGQVGGSKSVKIKDLEILLVRDSETTVRAINDTCTHKKCKVKYKADTNDLFCKCHKSGFTLDGKVTAGPAPRPLDVYPAQLQDGRIIISLPD